MYGLKFKDLHHNQQAHIKQRVVEMIIAALFMSALILAYSLVESI